MFLEEKMKISEKPCYVFIAEWLFNMYCDCEEGSENCEFCYVLKLALYTLEVTTTDGLHTMFWNIPLKKFHK